jgi:hypothetical protein
MTGSIILGDVAQRAQVLAIACSRCERAGRYPVVTLIARYGAACPVPLLLRRLSADCPKRQVESQYDTCGMNAPDLPTLFRTG